MERDSCHLQTDVRIGDFSLASIEQKTVCGYVQMNNIMWSSTRKGDLATDLIDRFLLCFCLHSFGLNWTGLDWIVCACVSGNTSARTDIIKFCLVTSFKYATSTVQSNHDETRNVSSPHITFIVVAMHSQSNSVYFCTFILIFTVVERNVCLFGCLWLVSIKFF